MIMQENTGTSLARAVGPTLRADWFARAWKWHAPFRAFISYLLCTLVSLIAVAVWAKTMGWAAVPWAIGGGILITAIITLLPLTPVTTLVGWIAGMLRHQAGGEQGFSAQDGFNGGADYAKAIWQFIKDILFWTPLVFFGIGLFRVEDNLLGVIPFLGVSLALIIHYAGREGTFFRNLVVLIYTLIIIWILGTWTPPFAERQQQFTNWWTLNVSRNQADRASDVQNADQHAKNVLAADNCFADLKKMTQPTQEDRDRCEALRKSVGTYAYKNPAERARAEANARLRQARVDAAATCWKGITASSKPEAIAQCEALDNEIDRALVVATPPAPPPPQGTTGAGGTTITTTTASTSPTCDGPTWKEATYTPSEQRGRMDLGTLPPGRYEIRVAGQVWQDFYQGPNAFSHRYEADPDGRMGKCVDHAGQACSNRNGQVWRAPVSTNGVAAVIAPNEEYGKALVHAWGYPLPIGSRGQIHTQDELSIAIDANFYRNRSSYGGSGDWRVTIKQCV